MLKKTNLSAIRSQAGKKGGKAKTASKIAAVRANGRRGGRPPKPRPWVAEGWPVDSLKPCTMLIVGGTLMETMTIDSDGLERPEFPSRSQLSARLGLPVIGFRSGAGTPPYTRHGLGDRSGVPVADFEWVREAMNRTRELFGVAPDVKDAASLRAWATQQLDSLRKLVETAQQELADGRWPWDGAARISEAADDYADALYALDDVIDDSGFDDSGFTYASPE